MTGRAESAARRLWTGSALLTGRRRDRVLAWVRAGRRGDLKGWRAAVGCWLRLAVVVLGVWVVWRIVRALPVVLWVLTPAWVVAAYRAGRTVPPAPVEEPSVHPQRTPSDDVRTLLLEVLGDRPAVHLSEVLAHLQKKGEWEGKKVADLRLRLEALGIPVQPKVKVGGVPTRGVRRVDLLTPPRPAATERSPEASTAV